VAVGRTPDAEGLGRADEDDVLEGMGAAGAAEGRDMPLEVLMASMVAQRGARNAGPVVVPRRGMVSVSRGFKRTRTHPETLRVVTGYRGKIKGVVSGVQALRDVASIIAASTPAPLHG
jgi:hypothetical protein